MQDDWDRDKAEFIAHPPDAPHPADGADQSPLAHQFAQLTKTLLNADSVAGVLEQVVRATFAVIPDADVVSVSLRSADGVLHTPVETDPDGVELDELQNRYGHGPCLDAARKEGVAYTYSGDLATETKWPQFGPAAADLGYFSVLSTALVPDAVPPRLSGALNIYSRTPGKLGSEITRDQALLLATHASLAVSRTQAVQLAELRETNLRRAVDSRDIIGQAKGILMQRRGISADEAFDLLRRTSQELNVRLAELAYTLASRHAELDPPGQ
ncbi:ANTAR domain-containing response regulator [Kibdelosporangium aridum]|uniref:ANTAR domain-containing response regulator n=1 Tax=Kibdelosporangium aridum TaxID=2030 RepID=UPI0005270BE9